MICAECNLYDKECKYCVKLSCHVVDTDDCMNAWMMLMRREAETE